MLALLLEIKNIVLGSVSQGQEWVSQYLPFMANQYVFATSIGFFVAVPILYLVLLADWKSNLPPRVPILLPGLTGKFSLQSAGPIEFVKHGFEKYGDIFRIKIINQGFTFLIGPKAGSIFFDASDKELKQQQVYRFTVPVFGKGIVYDAPPNVFVQQLKFLRHGLSGNAMRTHALKIRKETEDFFEHWGKEGKVDLFKELSELTILTASRCLLGNEVREKLHKEVADYYEDLNNGMTHLSILWPYAPTPAHRSRDRSRAKIAEILSAVINKRRAEQTEMDDSKKPDDFLQLLMDARYRDGRETTPEEITGLLLAALFAGQHTSSITSSFTGLMILSKKKELVPRLLQEQKEVLAKHNGELTYEALNEMDLLRACIKETLRLFPPLVLLLRYIEAEQTYKGFTIPKGDILVTCPVVSHRMSEVYKNPNDFNPDRFLGDHAEGFGKHEFIAFGGGRHACLGTNFAFLQLTTIWSVLLRNFDFDLADGKVHAIPDYTALVAGPKGNTDVLFKRKPAKEVF